MLKNRWQSAIDEVVAGLLEACRMATPPVDALRLARGLGVVVALDASQPGRARQKILQGQRSIFLRPEDRPERLQWAAAHELGEIHAERIFAAAHWSGDDVPPRLREQVANLFASRLLLPQPTFDDDARQCDFDLFELKELYRTASHELIARRLLDLRPDALLTIFDQGQLTTRMNGFGRSSAPLLPVERECLNTAHAEARPAQSESAEVRVRCWPVHEPGWQREILLMLPAGELDEQAFPAGDDTAVLC